MRTRRVAGIVAVALVAACGEGRVTEPGGVRRPDVMGPSLTHVDPVFLSGNPSCALVLAGSSGFRIDPPTPGTYSSPDGKVSFTWTSSDGIHFDWTSNVPISAVISKGGDGANVYYYDPPETSDDGLHSPVNASGGPAAISHIDVCYIPDIIILYGTQVAKTAQTRFTRTWDWTIEKTSSTSSLILSPGQQYTVGYQVNLGATSTDSDWEVYGDITVTNTNTGTGEHVMITAVTDNVPPAATVTCPETLPYKLEPEQSLTCSYTAAMGGAGAGKNTATVSASRGDFDADFEAYADWDFAAASMTKVDDCVAATDDRYGTLGDVCQDALPKSFSYTLNVGPYEACGEYTHANTASFTTDDRGATGSSTWTIGVSVPCVVGCTLTPGYWKTHSAHGPAPEDDAWFNLGPAGADESFFLSGQSYYQVLWTAPGGNVYYILAHAWIAAKLNVLDGASSTPDVDAALASAAAFFATYTPANAPTRGAARSAAIAWATTLDNYNNGLIGPGHCSE